MQSMKLACLAASARRRNECAPIAEPYIVPYMESFAMANMYIYLGELVGNL